MKTRKRRLPIPQHEFGFTPGVFNLILETSLDGDRVACERQQLQRDRELAAIAQSSLFVRKEAA